MARPTSVQARIPKPVLKKRKGHLIHEGLSKSFSGCQTLVTGGLQKVGTPTHKNMQEVNDPLSPGLLIIYITAKQTKLSLKKWNYIEIYSMYTYK